MRHEGYITITEDSYDDLVSKYLRALDRIMGLEIELFEIQEELSERTNG